MSIRIWLAAVALGALSTTATAQFSGTPAEQAACRPDVRRFCYKVPENQGANAFLQCLQEHRNRLSAGCRNVLEGHGV
jgi:hypothetical protein